MTLTKEELIAKREVVNKNLKAIETTYAQMTGQKILLDELIDGVPKVETPEDKK